MEVYGRELVQIPEIQGDGRFSYALDLRYADIFALEHYVTYPDVMKLKGQPVAVTLEATSDGVRVDDGSSFYVQYRRRRR